MKKAASAWPIAAASLALAGYILFAGAMPVIGRDFSMLSTVDYEPNAHETAEPFRDVAVGVSTEKANLAFLAGAQFQPDRREASRWIA